MMIIQVCMSTHMRFFTHILFIYLLMLLFFVYFLVKGERVGFTIISSHKAMGSG